MSQSKKLTVGQVTSLINSKLSANKKIKKRPRKQRSQDTGDIRTVRQAAPAAAGDIVSRPRSMPRMQTRNGGFYVCNTELVIELNSPAVLGAFQNVQHFTHPSFCTWLNTIGLNFSKFRWIRARYIYIPGTPTTTAGRVTLGMSYDTVDVAPTTTIAASAAYKSVSCPVWAGYEGSTLLNNLSTPVGSIGGAVAIDIDTNRFANPWYKIQAAATINGFTPTDRNMYVPCILNLSMLGGPVSALMGSIYLQYEVEMIEPIIALANA
jgi:hypothetical protein